MHAWSELFKFSYMIPTYKNMWNSFHGSYMRIIPPTCEPAHVRNTCMKPWKFIITFLHVGCMQTMCPNESFVFSSTVAISAVLQIVTSLRLKCWQWVGVFWCLTLAQCKLLHVASKCSTPICRNVTCLYCWSLVSHTDFYRERERVEWQVAEKFPTPEETYVFLIQSREDLFIASWSHYGVGNEVISEQRVVVAIVVCLVSRAAKPSLSWLRCQ